MHPQTRYARSGEAHIAYHIYGNGPIDLVFVPGFISHLEWMWQEPTCARFFERLASFSRVIAFDKRGTGLSDPVSAPISFEERMDDVRAVMDAAGSDLAVVFGVSEGGAMSALFAATYPERTQSLILYGAYPRVLWAPDYPCGAPVEALQKLTDVPETWGQGAGLSLWAPNFAQDPGLREWWGTLQRLSASPGMVKALFRLYFDIDVRSVLPAISVPTLVLHRRDDRLIPAGMGRYFAEHIPGARFVEFSGQDHLFFVCDTDSILDEMQEFLTGRRQGPDPDRKLLTVLFTDIVGSTQRAASLEDRRWHELLERHNTLVRRQLQRYRGQEVDNAGDGFLATFDGPARAVRCAMSIRDGLRALDIEIRAGIHTGECEIVADRVRGIAVHIGARVLDHAGPNEILVSGTVKDLVAGSGLQFSDRGLFTLKGVQGEWRLFAAE